MPAVVQDADAAADKAQALAAAEDKIKLPTRKPRWLLLRFGALAAADVASWMLLLKLKTTLLLLLRGTGAVEALIAWCWVAAALASPFAETENLCSCCCAMPLPQSCRLNAEAEVQSRRMALVAEL